MGSNKCFYSIFIIVLLSSCANKVLSEYQSKSNPLYSSYLKLNKNNDFYYKQSDDQGSREGSGKYIINLDTLVLNFMGSHRTIDKSDVKFEPGITDSVHVLIRNVNDRAYRLYYQIIDSLESGSLRKNMILDKNEHLSFRVPFSKGIQLKLKVDYCKSVMYEFNTAGSYMIDHEFIHGLEYIIMDQEWMFTGYKDNMKLKNLTLQSHPDMNIVEN